MNKIKNCNLNYKRNSGDSNNEEYYDYAIL